MKRIERRYVGFYDDGHDFGEIKYYSYYRNGSRKNMQDLENEIIKKFGISEFRYIKNHGTIKFGYLLDDEEY